jgi:hypothetical protein
MEKKQFDFYIDTKVTTWYRTPFKIDAETLEDAKEKAINFVESRKHTDLSWEQVDDTIEHLSVKDNNNWATEELFCDESSEKDNIWQDNIWQNSYAGLN